MRVLLTGATGFIGSSLLPVLTAGGHAVTAAVRSAASADAVRASGAEPLVLDFADGDRLAEAMGAVDGVVHLASDADDAEGLDRRVAQAAIDALAGSGKPYVHTGGAWVYGPGDTIEETDPYDPPELTAWRLPIVRLLEDADLPLTVVHPGIVYGNGTGISLLAADGPRTGDGRRTTIGSGEQHWTTIHVDDLAALYAAVLEAGSGFDAVLGVSGDNPRVIDVTAAAAGSDGVATEEPDATRARLGGPFADAVLQDQQAAGDRARAIGNWAPTRPSLLQELGG